MNRRKTETRNEKQWWVISYWLDVSFEGIQRRYLSDRKGKAIPYRRTEDRKGAGTNSVVRGIWRLRVSEAERKVREGV